MKKSSAGKRGRPPKKAPASIIDVLKLRATRAGKIDLFVAQRVAADPKSIGAKARAIQRAADRFHVSTRTVQVDLKSIAATPMPLLEAAQREYFENREIALAPVRRAFSQISSMYPAAQAERFLYLEPALIIQLAADLQELRHLRDQKTVRKPAQVNRRKP